MHVPIPRSRWSLPALLALLAPALGASGNVLLVVLDDVGVDRVRAYGEHPDPPPTPTLDALAAQGVLFRQAWSNPLCSPTRATLMTGRYSFRTGIGHYVHVNFGGPGLDLAEWTLPEVLSAATGGGVRSALIGKWHLGNAGQGSWNAMAQGFEVQYGAPWNLGEEPVDYYSFLKSVPGGVVHVDGYATTDETDDALRTIAQFGDDPWLVVLAYHAAHVPYHRPPPELHDRVLSGDPKLTPTAHHEAALQALDTELGRLLARIEPDVMARTTVMVLGDNGTQGPAMEPPSDKSHGKGTLYDGSVRVPLIVAGAAVAPGARGTACEGFVNTTDVFATVAELFGVDARAVVPPAITLDSVSFADALVHPGLGTAREFLFAERFQPNHATQGTWTDRVRAVRGTRFKLIRDELSGAEQMYDLFLDPGEQRDLLPTRGQWSDEVRRAHLDLGRRLATLAE